MYVNFGDNEIRVKITRPRKKRSLAIGWEGPYIFVGYKDGGQKQEEDDWRIYIVKGGDENNENC